MKARENAPTETTLLIGCAVWLIVLRHAVFSLSAFCVLPTSIDLEVTDIVFFDSSVFMPTNCHF